MKDELKIIRELMEQLEDEMKYSEDDFSERLGREKPKVDVVSISASEESSEDKPEEEEEEEEENFEEFREEEKSSPEEELKKRLLKLRGE